MRGRLLLSLVAILLLSLFVAACSSDDEDTATDTTTDTTTETVTETATDVPADTSIEVDVVVEATAISDDSMMMVGDMVAGDDRFGGTLRVVAQASTESLDTSFSGAYVITVVSAHIWERLFERDAGFNAKPQMVSEWEVDAAGTTFTFTLRDGLKFHDGSSVTSDDVIPSLQRMWETTAAGEMLRTQMAEGGLKKVDDKTFSMTFQKPIGVVITGLAAPWPLQNIWPESIANTPAQEDHGEDGAIGSGPYKLAEWIRGDKLVVERFDDYVPRSEEGSYLAGAKIAYLDRIEWLEVPAEETKIAGLKTGEWDVVDGAGLDFFADLNKEPNLQVAKYERHFWTFDFNMTSAPANLKKLRQGIQAAVDIEALAAAVGPSDLWSLCPARYRCGSSLESHVGAEFYNEHDVEKGKRLVAESGYDGETFLLMNPNDYATITPMGQVLKPAFEELGIVVEMPSMDWATLLSRLPDPDWDAITDWWVQWASPDPVADGMTSGTLYFGNFGDDPDVEIVKALRLEYAFEPDAVRQLEIIGEIQLALFESVPQVIGAQWASIYPATTDLKNFTVDLFPVYVNVWLER
jgi:peptide/nickel transport system substrate-binding protein